MKQSQENGQKPLFWRQIAEYFGDTFFFEKKCPKYIFLPVSKIGVFGHFLEIASLDLHIMIERNDI